MRILCSSDEKRNIFLKFQETSASSALDRTDKMECTLSSALKSQLVYLRLELVFWDEELSVLAAACIWLRVPLLVVQPSFVPVI